MIDRPRTELFGPIIVDVADRNGSAFRRRVHLYEFAPAANLDPRLQRLAREQPDNGGKFDNEIRFGHRNRDRPLRRKQIDPIDRVANRLVRKKSQNAR